MNFTTEHIQELRKAIPQTHVKELRVLCAQLLDALALKEKNEQGLLDAYRTDLQIEGDREAREREERVWG